VIGSGQSGCQIAEELHLAGREVVLSCGRAPWFVRRLGGRDIVWWSTETGFLDQPVGSLPAPSARLAANVLATGRDGGHDLHLRSLRTQGVTLAGRFLGSDGRRARFAPDLAASVSWGDDRYREFAGLVRTLVDGLYFLGVHFLRKRKSSLLCGVGEDAALVADAISRRLGSARR
jgi:putative flavoprotein involved in K+ transport